MKRMSFRPDEESAYEARRAELMASFETWLAGLPLHINSEDFGLLLDWKWGHGDGRLDRWRRSDLEEFLLVWCPDTLSNSAEDVSKIPSTVALSMSFLHSWGLLKSSDPVERLTEHAMALQQDFLAEMAEAVISGAGPGLEGVDLPTIGPVQLPTQEAVRESADSAPVLVGFSELASYLAAPGKPLTQQGNLKMADAKVLGELLGTSDVIETKVGDQVFRKQSSTQLLDLDHWRWWAQETGAIRRVNNRMVGVKAWQQRRRKDPVHQVRRAFDVLTTFGPLASFSPDWQDRLTFILDESVGPLLGRLLQATEPLDYGELVETWTEMAAAVGETEPYPGAINRSFDRLVSLLERVGVLSQSGEVRVPAPFTGSTRSGGFLQLTPVGVVLAIELLEEQGIPVEIMPSPDQMTASHVAASSDNLDPPQWWDMAATWIELQPDTDKAVNELVHALAERSLLMLILALDTLPEALQGRVAPVLRALAMGSDGIASEPGSIAMNWLLQNNLVDPDTIEDDVVVDSLLVTLGAVAAAEPSLVGELMSQDHDDAEQLELITAVGRRLPPRAVELLEAIATESTHKRVAKAARKELFRVRSKLVAQRNRG
jgi:hypothetical protein